MYRRQPLPLALQHHQCPMCGHDRFEACRLITVVQTIPLAFDAEVQAWIEVGTDELGDSIDSGPWEPTGYCTHCHVWVRFAEFQGIQPLTNA